jgi:hypothetical protein
VGPEGAHLVGATDPIYTLRPGDAAYQSLPANSALKRGWGYWAYFAQSGSLDLTGATDTTQPAVTSPNGQWVMAGDPSGQAAAAISGADIAYTCSPSAGYQAATSLTVGQGAWVIAARPVTITAGPAPAATASPSPSSSPAATGPNCATTCAFTGVGTINASFVLRKTVGSTTSNTTVAYTRTVSFTFQISVAGGQANGQGTFTTSINGACPVPSQSDWLTVSGQFTGSTLQLTFANAGKTMVSIPVCTALKETFPRGTLDFNRFIAGDKVILTVDARDGATGSTTTFPNQLDSYTSFLASVTLHAVAGQ